MAIEQGVSIQQDTLSPVAGGPVRTIQGTVLINGVPTTVQMQVVVFADQNGVLTAPPPDSTVVLTDLLAVMKDVRTLLSQWLGVGVIDQTVTVVTSGL